MKWTDQDPPKPEGFKGNDVHGKVMTGQDGRLAYEPGAGDITTIEELIAMRNVRDA